VKTNLIEPLSESTDPYLLFIYAIRSPIIQADGKEWIDTQKDLP
jgi:hypothetical protein